MAANYYPPPAFYFKVVFLELENGVDSSFQEVSGLKASIDTEPYTELGGSDSVYQLPKPATYTNLILKRGVADSSSPLVKWCQTIFEGDFAGIIKVTDLLINLMSENNEPLCSWSIYSAFPIGWNVDVFNSTKNQVAIETFELRYRSFSREL